MPEVIFATLDDIAGIEAYEAHTKAVRVLMFAESKPLGGELLLRFVVPDDWTFPAAFSTSGASADVAATASAVFSITKNGVEVGTCTFAGGASVGVFAGAGGGFATGDVLKILAPASTDATLENISITLEGERT